MAKRRKKIAEKVEAKRRQLWPDVTKDDLWDRRRYDGFITLPRTMPLILSIIDDLTKGQPASSTYLELWGRSYDEMYVSLGTPDSHAFHAGFEGQRARRTWQQRIAQLAKLGFIRTAPGPSGPHSYALIMNPHVVIRKLKEKNIPGLIDVKYSELVLRCKDIGATDIDPPSPPVEKHAVEFDNDDIPF